MIAACRPETSCECDFVSVESARLLKDLQAELKPLVDDMRARCDEFFERFFELVTFLIAGAQNSLPDENRFAARQFKPQAEIVIFGQGFSVEYLCRT